MQWTPALRRGLFVVGGASQGESCGNRASGKAAIL